MERAFSWSWGSNGSPLHFHELGMFVENPVVESQPERNGTQVGHKPVEQLLAHGQDRRFAQPLVGGIRSSSLRK